MRMTKVRIRETGQVLDMVPAVATSMILGGTATEVKAGQPESMTVAAGVERAVTPQAATPRKKPAAARR